MSRDSDQFATSKPLWWHLLDRAYKMMWSAGYRITEQNPDQNDPIGAWMSDVRLFLQTVPEAPVSETALTSNSHDGGKAPRSSVGRTALPGPYEVMPQWVEEELKDGDRICEAAGVQRTEGGRLPVAKIINKISARSAERRMPICEDHRNGELEWPDLTEADDACAACRITYLEAQESLLEEWQQRAKRAEEAIAEIQRPLDKEMARLNETVTRLNTENERLRTRSATAFPDLSRFTDAELTELDFQVSNEIAQRATAI